MKTLPCALKPGVFAVLTAIFLVLVHCCSGVTWGYESAGMELRIYADQEHPELRYWLGEEPVDLVVVIRNVAGSPLLTERGFSQVELRHTLVVTDPQGVKYTLSGGEMLHKMPVPFFLKDLAWALAEYLPQGWVRSVAIEDLTELVPVMKTKAGWYTIEAFQPFLRFASAGQDPGLGLLGLLDEPGNWSGIIKSNTIQLYIEPREGALIEVNVADGSEDPQPPLAQVPVKLFRTSDIPSGYTLQTTWEKIKPVFEGTTNFSGNVVWKSDTSCVVQDSYSILASYGGEIKSALITATESGWLPGCTGSIQKTLVFGTLAYRRIHIVGAGFNFPQDARHRAVFLVNTMYKDPMVSGKVSYEYMKTKMLFGSTKIKEISVTGTTAKIKGEGTVNHKKNYTFEAIVVDGSPDQFGITIWKPNGVLHYQAPTKALGGGRLRIVVK